MVSRVEIEAKDKQTDRDRHTDRLTDRRTLRGRLTRNLLHFDFKTIMSSEMVN